MMSSPTCPLASSGSGNYVTPRRLRPSGGAPGSPRKGKQLLVSGIVGIEKDTVRLSGPTAVPTTPNIETRSPPSNAPLTHAANRRPMPRAPRPKLILIPVHQGEWEWEKLMHRALRRARLYVEDIAAVGTIHRPAPGVQAKSFDAHLRIEVCAAPPPRVAFIDGKQVEI